MSLFPFEGGSAHFGDDVESLVGDFVDLATFLPEAWVGRRDDIHIFALYHNSDGGSSVILASTFFRRVSKSFLLLLFRMSCQE